MIITLILLSVVTFMAITFLALSRRERSAVSTVTDTAGARLAADAALANAEAQIIANALSTTNPFNFTLLVSTNYINANGFVNGSASPTNVNYFHFDGTPVIGDDFLQLLANLYYSPRAPVFIPTNSAGTNGFRFYFDLNRNGRDDPNGNQPQIGPNGGYLHPDGTENNNPVNVVTNFMVGDPEWIGVLERPDAPYGPNNKFIARYAFIAVPVGNTLDLNAIHNQALIPSLNNPVNPMNSADDSYFRNQGVGSWEINLAAFLADLNTNQWGQIIGNTFNGNTTFYYYQYPPSDINQGAAFNDAFALLAYRYNNNYGTLKTVFNLFGANGTMAFQNDNIDGYSDGPLQIGFQLPVDTDNANNLWAGADNTNHYFTHQELFSSNEISPTFVNRLLAAGNTNSTYDRYTFYRLLSQLGTDSTPESGKMNLSYSNALVLYDTNGVATNISIIPGAETNFVPWRPLDFFTVAADRLLRAYTTQWRNSDPANFATTFYAVPSYTFTNINFTADQWTNYPAFGIGHIPVLVSNRFVYSPAVNRLLQLAANMYDATTNRYYPPDYGMALPTLFQPVFSKVVFNGLITNVYITSFVEYTGSGATLTNTVPLDLGNPTDLANLRPFNLVYGVPIIIGAKKGLPNFNQFAMQSVFSITRKLQITRGSTNIVTDPPSSYKVNQMFNCSVSNQYAVECWNSYFTNYTRPTTIWVSHKIQMVLTNDETQQPWYPLDITNDISTSLDTWTGTGLSMNPDSFKVTNYSATLLPTEVYQFSPPQFITNSSPNFESNVVINGSSYPQPHWWLAMTNDLQVVLIDNSSGRAIDYVQLNGPTGVRDLTAEILASTDASMWLTKPISSSMPSDLPSGVYNQITAAKAPYNSTIWGNTSLQIAYANIDGLNNFYHDPVLYNRSQVFGSTNLEIGVIGVSALTAQYITWQANDPLVHYIASDLTDTANNAGPRNSIANHPLINQFPNERWQPWGVVNQMAKIAGVDQTPCNLAFKDPLMRRSDDWDFPANKFPTVGWLGRVHRGTPWQTVYLKSSAIDTNTWVNWTGNLNLSDATNAAPVKDRLLFDLFTTTLNDNATRGTLSVNVEAGLTNNPVAGLAAWSALFGGVMVLSNNAVDPAIQPILLHAQHNGSLANFTAFPINPAGPVGIYSPLGRLVNGINQKRMIFTNADGLVGTFEHVGDILSVPALTEQSSFLHLSNYVSSVWVDDPVQKTNGISDEMYEWLPQQTMSLLRVGGSPQTPMRYVIYCYGQALKPAPNGIYTLTTPSGMFGMITNYQVVSEIATRAVVRFGSTLTNNIVFDVNTTNWVSQPMVTNNNAVIESFNILPPD